MRRRELSMADEYVLELQRIDSTMLASAGGKGANLGELSRVDGIDVPAGFCVTTRAFEEAIADSRETAALLDELSRVGADDSAGLSALGAHIRDLIEATPVPVEVENEIGRQLTALGDDGAYAVRS